jgi:hypothetical protein
MEVQNHVFSQHAQPNDTGYRVIQQLACQKCSEVIQKMGKKHVEKKQKIEKQ